MKQRNWVIFRGFTRLGIAAAAVCGVLLSGCGQGVKKPPTTASGLPAGATGIAACDSYLNSYLACHRAAGIYPADALDTHYQAMRGTLLEQAKDPGQRPYLANRCLGLAQQLHDALQGRACAPQNAASR